MFYHTPPPPSAFVQTVEMENSEERDTPSQKVFFGWGRGATGAEDEDDDDYIEEWSLIFSSFSQPS